MAKFITSSTRIPQLVSLIRDTDPEAARLLSEGVYLASRDADGDSLLHRAARLGQKATVQMMIDKGADPQNRNAEGKTAIDLAVEAGHDKIVEMLRSKVSV